MAALNLLFVICVTAQAIMSPVVSSLKEADIDERIEGFIQEVTPYREDVKVWARSIIGGGPTLTAHLSCPVCRSTFQFMRPLIGFGGSDEAIERAIIRVCMLFDMAQSDEICIPTVRGYASAIIYMIKNKPELTNDDFCGFINSNCGKVNRSFTDWEVEIANGQPIRVEPPPLSNLVHRTKILHFTDLHLDLDYAEGMNTDCTFSVCCRKSNGIPTDPANAAGPYGYRRCGLPLKGWEELLKNASESHKDAKYIFLTGDYMHNALWEYGIENNTRHIKAVTQTLRKAFPNTVVIPLSANHDVQAVNLYPPPSANKDFPLAWMYNAISEGFEENMGGWIPVLTFRHGGFYTTVPEPGLRFIVLNTNLCYTPNFWLPFDPIDPIDQLKWFSETMAKAEAAHEKVYLLGHVPPGTSECWRHWSRQYDRIVNRYSHLIQLQFFGHMHNEFYTVSFDKDASGAEIPTSLSFMGPSAFPEGNGIGFKVYYVDGDRGINSTWELIDHETWLLNVTKANEDNNPVWYKEYAASETFGLTAHRPANYYDLTLRMAKDKNLYQKYRKIYLKNDEVTGFGYSICPSTDEDCAQTLLCYTAYYTSADGIVCEKIKRLLNRIDPETGDGDDESGGASLIISQIFSLLLIFLVLLQ